MKRVRHTPGEVDVHVKGRNLTVTPALHDQVVSKLQRLDKYMDRLQQIDVELWRESSRDSDQQCHVEATTHVAGRTIRVSSVSAEMFAAVDETVDRLYRQLNRRKERIKAHHGSKIADLLPPQIDEAGPPEGAVSPTTTDPAPADRSIHVERLDVKPMFEDEAAAEMEEQGHTFFVFLNARNEQVNVLYRRDNGDYCLIEPHVR